MKCCILCLLFDISASSWSGMCWQQWPVQALQRVSSSIGTICSLHSAYLSIDFLYILWNVSPMTDRRNSMKLKQYFFLSLTSLTLVTIFSAWAGSLFYLMPKFGTHLHKNRILPIPKLSSPSIDGFADSTKQQEDLGIVHNYQQNIVNGIRPADVCSSLVWKWEAWMNNILTVASVSLLIT